MISTDKPFFKLIAIAVLVVALVAVATSKGTLLDLLMPETAKVAGMPQNTHLGVPQDVPDLAFKDMQGRDHTLSEFKGRVVLLNLWATWCAPCAKEKPSLQEAQLRWLPHGLNVISLSMGDSPETIKAFFDQHKIMHLNAYIDPDSKALGLLRARGLPTSIILNRDGREIYRRSGPADWESEEMAGLIEVILKANTP